MKLFRLTATAFLFLLPAIVGMCSNTYAWIVCSFYLYLHLFHIKYVRATHKLDKIDSVYNFNLSL